MEPNKTIPNSLEKVISKKQEMKIYRFEQIQRYLKDILVFIKKICFCKFNENLKSFQDIIKENKNMIPTEIQMVNPYIMEFGDFKDTLKLYSYIINVFKLHLFNIVQSKPFDLELFIIKDIIDISSVIELVIQKDVKLLETNDIKFYLYHLVNLFSESEKKIEYSKYFFKFGIKLLVSKFGINQYEEFFPEPTKIKGIRELCDFALEITNNIIQIYNQILTKQPNFECNDIYDKIKAVKLNLGKILNNIKFKGIKDITEELYNLVSILILNPLRKINQFKFYFHILTILLGYLEEENEKDVLYSIIFIKIKNTAKKPIMNRNSYYESLLSTYKMTYGTLEEKIFEYLIKFNKYKKLKVNINGDKNELILSLNKIIKDKVFQKKIINFFQSEEFKEFLQKKIDNDLYTKIKEKYNNFISLLSNDEFWDSILFYTLPKYIKGFVTNYLRIVLNDNFIIFNLNGSEKEKKISILNFYLFEVTIHEICHFLRRLYLTNVDSKEAITPPGTEDKKKGNIKGEIGEELMKYFFGYRKINLITYNQAIQFQNLFFDKKEDFEKLKNIIIVEGSFHEKYSDYAKFLDSSPGEDYIIIKGQCLNSYVNQFNY